jgi:CheY-like chemotaxis protein
MPSRSVLIVEDHEETRAGYQLFLEQRGWHVSTAPSGEHALRQLLELRPSVIVLDVMLPGINGLKVLERLRNHSRWNRIPVVLLTGHDLAGQPEGCARLLSKPMRPEELAAEIERLVP